MTKKTIFVRMILGGFLAAAVALAAPLPKHPKLADDFQSTKLDETVDVIIQYNEPVAEKHVRTLEHHGARHKQTFQFINAALASVPASALEAIANDPAVAHISPNRQVQGQLDHSRSAVNYIPVAQYL